MNRRGVALLAALVALLLAGALAALVLAAARLRWLSGYRQIAGREALEGAAGAAAWHTAEWDSVVAGSLLPGMVTSLVGRRLPGSLRTHDSIIRLGSHLYLVRSVGEVTTGDGSVLARDGVAQLVELWPAAPPDSAVGAVRHSRRPGVVDLPGHLRRGPSVDWLRHQGGDGWVRRLPVSPLPGSCRYAIEIVARWLASWHGATCGPGPSQGSAVGAGVRESGVSVAAPAARSEFRAMVRPVTRGWWRWP